MKLGKSLAAGMALLLGGTFIFLLWLFIFGGEVFGPAFDRASEDIHLREFLADCQPDELRLQNFWNGGEKEEGILHFKTGQLVGGGVPGSISHGLFWTEVREVFHTINHFSLVPPYTVAQVTKIKGTLATLKEPPFTPQASYRNQIHLAFYQGDQLRIYHCSKSEAPPDLKELLLLLNLSLLDQN